MNGQNGKNNLPVIEKQIRKFLFVSWESLSGDLALQIKKEGHEIKIYVKAESDKDVYDGFLEKVPNWKEYIDWADVIVFDDVGFGKEADELRKSGKLVVGGSVYTDKLEEDREFGQSEMKRVGMLILPHWDFTDYDLALKFIEENPGRYVYKPSGFTTSDSKGLLFLGKDEDGKDIHEIIRSNNTIFKTTLEKMRDDIKKSGYVGYIDINCIANARGIYPLEFTCRFGYPTISIQMEGITGEMGEFLC